MQEPFYNYYNGAYFNSGYNKEMVEEMQRRALLVNEAKQEKKEIKKLGNYVALAVVAFLAMQYAVAFFVMFTGTQQLYSSSNIYQYGINIIGSSFLGVLLPFAVLALANKKKYKEPAVPLQQVGAFNTALWVCFGMLVCVAANYVTSGVIQLFRVFGYQLTQSDSLQPDSVFSSVIYVIAIAFMPAICEELAMRCFALGLLKNYGKAFGVVAVSMVFGLLHGNVIQFVFATIVGLGLGYITVKTNSVVPAMLVHGFNNSMSAVQAIVGYYAGDSVSEKALVILYTVWIALGIAAGIVLLLKKQFKIKREEKAYNPYALTLGQKLSSFFFVPGMILPAICLLYLTVTSVEKI